VLQVESLDRSLVFYRDVLGFEVTFRSTLQASCIGEFLSYLGGDVESTIPRFPESDPGTVHIAFCLADHKQGFGEYGTKVAA